MTKNIVNKINKVATIAFFVNLFLLILEYNIDGFI